MAVNATDAIQISRRYATAIFALALEAKKEETVVEEMQVIAAAITENDNLKDALANPLVGAEQKTAILAKLVSKANALTKRAVDTITTGNRSSLIPMIASDLAARLAEHQDEVEATITSARALPAATQKQLLASLEKATGKTIKLKLNEDASVLGGLRIELGSLRLDATLAGALTTMREQLLAPTH